jgi:hypothetical protein
MARRAWLERVCRLRPFDYLEEGSSVEDFLEGFPAVTREQVIEVLETRQDAARIEFRIKILIDECIDVPLRNFIIGHDVLPSNS